MLRVNFSNRGGINMAKYCSTCGKTVHENAVICPYCGCALAASLNSIEDKPSLGIKILSFLIPIAGLVLFCVYLWIKPISAKSYGLWALIGFITGILLSACSAVMMVL